MRPNPTQFEPLESVAVFAFSVMVLFGAGAFFIADLGLAGIVVGQLCIGGPALLFAHRRAGSMRAGARLLGFRPASGQALLGAALLGVSFWYLNQTFAWPIAERYLEGEKVVRELEETMMPSGRPLWLSLVVFGCFPALCEEILLRGTVARGLRPALGLAGAVAVSALLFGLLHMLPAQMLVTALFGVPLGIATLASGSLLPAILMHFLNNATTILLAGGALPSLGTALEREPQLAAIIAAVLSLAGLALLLRAGIARAAEGRSS